MEELQTNETLAVIKKAAIDTVQVNLGNRCNQACHHCHIGASPKGDKNMDKFTAEKVIEKLLTMNLSKIEFTGGTPEMNPNFTWFLESLSDNRRKLVVRTSLSVLDLPEYSHFIDFYYRHNVKIIASFPSVFEDGMDKQRGKGVFKSSIKVLQRLNELGYGTNGRSLDLVYNAVGEFLPPSQSALEQEFKSVLKKNHDISFNNLISIVNSPIGRYKNHLNKEKKLNEYTELLINSYNPETLKKIMCLNLISVNYQGYIYDCDFNNALSIPVKGYELKKFWEIDFDNFSPEIPLLNHCFACTVNEGSSCNGTLLKNGETEFNVIDNVKTYYGKELKGSKDLKTNACCTLDSIPSHVKEVLPYIADEVKVKYYGCGSPVPLHLSGLNVLDLGCGTGRDTYILSKLVGENGSVSGIDMTEEQIVIAKKYIKEHTKRFGYKKENVRFFFDYIENLSNYFTEESIDLVVSNCVINLVKDKESVINQVFKILKSGGEFYFSDVYADRRVPADIKNDPVLHGECLGGALYFKDFERIAKRAGFIDPRVISKSAISITDDSVKKLVGNINFCSITYRLWKLEGLEDACEEFGHIAIYKGNLPESPHKFELDGNHIFERGLPAKICGNSALMLSKTRYKDFFNIIGGFDEHFGEFKDCGSSSEKKDERKLTSGCC